MATQEANVRQVGVSGGKAAADAKIEADAQAALLAQANALLKGVSTEKAMRMFGRTVNDNKKLDKFLSGVFKLPSAFDPDKVDKQIADLIQPHKKERGAYNHYGLLNAEKQRALLNAMVDSKVSAELVAKQQWLDGFNLNDEQKTAAVGAMKAYEATLRAGIKSATRWKQVYAEKVVAPKPEPAPEKTTEPEVNTAGPEESVTDPAVE